MVDNEALDPEHDITGRRGLWFPTKIDSGRNFPIFGPISAHGTVHSISTFSMSAMVCKRQCKCKPDANAVVQDMVLTSTVQF